jgi:replicative DNA helicase
MSAFPEISLERGMPASPDAERSILGAILLDNEHFHEAAEKLLAEDLSLDSHRRIYARMSELMQRGQAVDLVTLVEELARRKEIESVGGVAYIASLTEGLPRRISIREYVDIVQEKSKLRRVIHLCNSAMTQAIDQSTPADDLIAAADRDLLVITAEQASIEDTIAAQSMREMEELKAQRKGLSQPAYSTGIAQLDMLTGGLRIGQLTMLGGRPGIGKSALAVQLIRRNCGRGIPCHLFAVEMTAGETIRRIWAGQTGISFDRLQDPTLLNDAEMGLLIQAQIDVSSWPLQIDESDSLTPDQLIARARIMKRRMKTGVLVIDYLQKMSFPGDSKQRYLHISECLRRVAALLKAERIAGLVLSSLTDHDGKDGDVPPTLGDFRDCGDIKYHAHVAWLLHRSKDAETGVLKNETDLNTAKNRGGRCGISKLEYLGHRVEFCEPERGLYE